MRIRSESLLSFVVLFILAASVSAQAITEFPLPPAGSAPTAIAAGPDGNLWFTEYNDRIGRITTAGVITEFPLPTAGGGMVAIVAGPDGNLWFTEFDAQRIGRITTGGVITEFQIMRLAANPAGIAAGPDGSLWFSEHDGDRIGRITTDGVITEFWIPTNLRPGPGPIGITAGPDGNLWFAEADVNRIGRITTGGVMTHFPIRTSSGGPFAITAGPDGNLWFTEYGGKIGRITPSGVINEFSIPTSGGRPRDITTGPDGNLWFTEETADKVGRITTSGAVTEFSIPTPGSRPIGISAGPDGNIWFAESRGNKIGRLSVVRRPTLETRIFPVVGSTAGVGGSFFRTAIQLSNSSEVQMIGRIVFHRSGVSGGESDPVLSYSLASGQTMSIADLLPYMGHSGIGSANIEATSGSIPVATARVFNDAGKAGTTGFTEEPMRSEDALRPGQSGVLLLPADLTSFRFNLGVRTLGAGAAATLTRRDAAGVVVATVSRAVPATYHEQQSASAFLGASTLPAGGSISIAVSAGAAIFYGATVDNRTGDPSLQIARATP
jgi:streptogramin lyase